MEYDNDESKIDKEKSLSNNNNNNNNELLKQQISKLESENRQLHQVINQLRSVRR
jgi:hypothetical protein